MNLSGNSHNHCSQKPLVSSIIATFDRPQMLTGAIESVLSQSYQNLEVLVIDNSRSPVNRKIVEQFGDPRLRYIESDRNSIAHARNIGLKESKGQFVTFLDDDDLWYEKKIEKQVDILQNLSAKWAFTFSGAHIIDEAGDVVETFNNPHGKAMTFDSLFDKNFIISPGTALIRRECIKEIGFFDERVKGSNDYDYFLRLAKIYRFHFDEEILYKYRRHQGNFSRMMDVRIHDHRLIFDKREITEGKSRLAVRKRVARTCYYAAHRLSHEGEYFQASKAYALSLWLYPLIGLQYWPFEVRRIRFSFVYRVLKVYYLAAKNFICSLSPGTISAARRQGHDR